MTVVLMRPQALTRTELARRWRVHPNTIKSWADQGHIPALRIGPRRDYRFRVADVEAYEQLRHRPVVS